MEYENGADVECWAKNIFKIPVLAIFFFYRNYFFLLPRAINYLSVTGEISAATLLKTIHGKTHISKILKWKSKFLKYYFP
jgi:hypothetical protein